MRAEDIRCIGENSSFIYQGSSVRMNMNILKNLLNTNKSCLNNKISVEGNNSSCYNLLVTLYSSQSEEEYV